MTNPDDLNALIAGLYDGVDDPAAFKAAFSTLLARIGAEGGNLRLNDVGGRPLLLLAQGRFHEEPSTIRAYVDYWHAKDAHADAALRSGVAGRIVLGQGLIDAARERSDPYLNEFYFPAGCGPVVGGFYRAGARSVVIGAVRAYGAAPFEEAERAELERLAPHLQRIAHLRWTLEAAGQAAGDLAAALNADGAAAARLASDGRVLWECPGLAAMLAPQRAIARRGPRFVWRDPKDAEAFEARLAAACGRDPEALGALFVRSGENRLLRIALVPAPGRPGEALASFRAVDIDAPRPPQEALRRLFGLSPAEARLAAALAAGMTLAEAADAFDVAEATVRSQLRAVFQKTGVSRQAELASVLSRIG